MEYYGSLEITLYIIFEFLPTPHTKLHLADVDNRCTIPHETSIPKLTAFTHKS